MSSFTDPNRKKATDPGKIEGNTVFMYHDLINQNSKEVDELKKRYKEGTVGDVEVKQKLIEAHVSYFSEARKRRKELEGNLDLVRNILAGGAKKAALFADTTLKEVYETIGILNKLNGHYNN